MFESVEKFYGQKIKRCVLSVGFLGMVLRTSLCLKMKTIYHYFQDFVALFFPELCVGCGMSLLTNEQSLCTSCIFHLPRTNFHLDPDNLVARAFWGRIPFVYAGAFVYFQKGGKVQNMMHQLKYNNKCESGFRMGELYGYDLKHVEQWQDIDLIIPVPLHPKKKRLRGYNQSEYIAQGLASVLHIPVSTTHLVKEVHTSSQTKKSRFARYENLAAAFSVQNSVEIEGKHILLTDDVITTGATLETCAKALLEVKDLRIRVMMPKIVGGDDKNNLYLGDCKSKRKQALQECNLPACRFTELKPKSGCELRLFL
jgi:ComF family protein